MTKCRKKRKNLKRVPFVPDAGLCRKGSSLHQIFNQISLPDYGTIFSGRLFFPEKSNGRRLRRAAFCGFSRGSLTAEAAFALPLFFLCVICLISIINVYGMTLKKASALRDAAETAAITDMGGSEERFIDLDIPWLFTPYFLPEGAASALIPCRAYVRVWNGRDANSAAEGETSASDMVYVTDYESVYHTDEHCTHLDLRITPVSAASVSWRRNEYGGKYHACEKCAAAGASGSSVYITPYGDCYHTSAHCAGLTRSVRLVPKDELDGSLCRCSRCAAKAA